MPKHVSGSSSHKSVGNSLGTKNAPQWKANSFGPGTFNGPDQGKVASHFRPGAGQKAK